VPGQDSARALVSQPGLIPLVILRGSGDSTRSLAAEAARHGVRTLAHADGGAVLFVDAAADPDPAAELVDASLDRLGVCNRLNLLLVHPARWDEMLPRLRPLPARLGIGMSLPHARPPARPRVGAGRRVRGDRDDRARRRPAGRRDRRRGDLRAGRGDRHPGRRPPRSSSAPTPGPARSGT
jgi:acyl-CoA reductase-like NAD-dependent aldehyde dehydrogenase